MLTDALLKCAKFTEKVIPKIVKQKIIEFEKSHTNFVRSVKYFVQGWNCKQAEVKLYKVIIDNVIT